MKPFTTIAVFVFVIISVAHLLRVILSWSVKVNGLDIPNWPSIVALLFAALMAVMVWKENK